jgi:hypothetical protein
LSGLPWTGEPILFKAASRFAALNPAELTANQRILGCGEVALSVTDFQDFCQTAPTVQYRFTRERSLSSDTSDRRVPRCGDVASRQA